jgi:hypothetical protein
MTPGRGDVGRRRASPEPTRWDPGGCANVCRQTVRNPGDGTRASSQLAAYGSEGQGEWISVYANSGHAYVVIAGLRFDTSGRGEEGPKWRPEPRSGRGYTVGHPPGL